MLTGIYDSKINVKLWTYIFALQALQAETMEGGRMFQVEGVCTSLSALVYFNLFFTMDLRLFDREFFESLSFQVKWLPF